MKLYEYYPCHWMMLIIKVELLARQYIEDNALNVELCHN